MRKSYLYILLFASITACTKTTSVGTLSSSIKKPASNEISKADNNESEKIRANQSAERKIKKSDLVGRWELTGTAVDRGNGGTITWNSLPQNYKDTLEFSPNKSFSQVTYDGYYLRTCTGTFRSANDQVIILNTNCSSAPEAVSVTELTDTSMVLNYQGRDGISKRKYETID